jgi:hypothetical protein
MKILPWGKMLPVHCCCEPGKRLGWVPAPSTPGPIAFMAGHRSVNLLDGETIMPTKISTCIDWLQDGTGRRLAVNSADTPIETWRKVPGFIEDHATY